MAEPTRLPSAPTPRATNIDTTPTRTAAIPLAAIVRPRRGIIVYVVRPVRWVYSPVTDRIAIIGRITDIGTPMAVAKSSKSMSASGAKRIAAPVATTDRMAMLISIQKPARVSNILRSSTPTIRPMPIGGTTLRSRAAAVVGMVVGWTVVAVMPLLLLAGCRR